MKNIIKKICQFKYLPVLLLLIPLLIWLSRFYPVRPEITDPEQALIPVRFFLPDFNDDMDLESLSLAVEKNFDFLDRVGPDHMFQYGPDRFTCSQVRESHEAFLEIIRRASSPKELSKMVRENFNVYKAAGGAKNRKVLFTGYFEPEYEASLIPDDIFRYPLYGMPEDLVKIDLSQFSERFSGESISARIDGLDVVPYYTREDIEFGKALQGRGLELAWLKDPVDVAFLHIQGSGRLRLKDSKILSAGYLAANGRQYKSIGKHLLDRELMTREEMSMQSIRTYLTENAEIVDEVLNYNPSYVFFRIRQGGPYGNIEVPLTPGRSMALNVKLFPKGSLCFILCEKPILNREKEIDKWVPFSRFIMNQDTGGAITGTGRADIFWGSDEYAEIAAGHMKHEGKLFVLMKKGLKTQ